MRHLKAGKRLGRTTAHRKALMRNLVTSLLKHGQIKTTVTKAKEMRKEFDKMITLAKRGDLHARRQALSFVQEKNVVAKLFNEYGPLYQDRNGGYTRIYKTGNRLGDNADMALIQMVGLSEEAPAAKPAKAKIAEVTEELKKETPKKAAPKKAAETKEAKSATKADDADAKSTAKKPAAKAKKEDPKATENEG